MESFFRYVAYVDYYKNKEKIRNVGFLKWKFYNQKNEIEIKVKGLPKPWNALIIREINSNKELGYLSVEQGFGNYEETFILKEASKKFYIELEKERLYLEEIKGFWMEISEDEKLLIYTDLKEMQEKLEIKENEEVSKKVEIKDMQKEYQGEKKPTNLLKINEIETINENKIDILKPIETDKWLQLCLEYPQIHPFANEKIFLSIKPKDFIILQKQYQKLVNNSFLLHGFYNYGHMILGKLQEEEDTPIYIGVPGVYYEREKQAAKMFGFVGFESVERPVQQGSYGYYMIEVKI